ncbi:MAG: hypothetical protein RM347_011220 [Nostoc sp. ChiQUE02]|uniref:hypothetical protein n=1 Tax=Nostoc sp. ChiQUE02 TaxID=3075377 RepID=UPI002AD3492C|nr:hypothetical protein [Nostoc sp. ChiQUE02]MDZ8235013.1 hypothetical protein [Nostoc sp. ChiQUE02]
MGKKQGAESKGEEFSPLHNASFPIQNLKSKIVYSMSRDFVTIIVFFTFVAVVINILYFQWENKKEQKRSDKIKLIFAQLKMNFLAEDSNNIIQNLHNFRLFNKGGRKLVKNILSKEIKNFKIYIFEYRYSISSAKTRYEHWQTVAFLYDDNMRFCKFFLKPKGILDQLSHFLGYQDIKFENYPRFYEQYLLRGSDEQGIRQIFTDNVLSFFEAKIGFYPAIQTTPCLEAADSCLIYYRENVRLEPEQIELFLQEGMEVFDLLRAKVSNN